MTISSRTPEGEGGSCPLCQARVVVEPSIFFGDATCPRCGQLLWFLQSPQESRFFAAEDSADVKDRITELIATRLGIEPESLINNPQLWSQIAADSLETVELVMALERGLDEDYQLG